MDEILQKIIDNDFSDLAGLAGNASVPMSQSLVNEIISAAIQGNKTLQSCRVSIHEHNRVSAKLKTALLPWSIALKLKLDKSVDFDSFSSPKIRAWLENNRLLGSLGSFFNALPEGVRLYGSQVVIDLGFFLQTPEQKKLLNLIKAVDILTEPGRVIFNIAIEVD